jgi:hypothetical protein
MIWVYNLPSWLVCFVFVFGLAGAALAGHRLWRRVVTLEYNAETTGLAMGMLAIVAMILSLLLAFSSVSVWDAYSGADSAAASEASVAGELVRDLAVYGGPAANATREAVRVYLQSIIAEEWPAMAKGGRSETASHKFNDIFRKAAGINPKSAREQIILAEIWDKTNELNVFRRTRLNSAGGSAVPGALWGTLALCILFNFLLFYGMPLTRVSDFMLGLYAATLGLMLFFIVAMDRPFSGSVSVSPDSYKTTLQSMQRWDSEGPAVKNGRPQPPAEK